MANTTTGSGLGQLAQNYYNTIAETRLITNWCFYPLGKKAVYPKHQGQTYNFYRYNNIAGTTATIAEDALTAGQVQLSAQTTTVAMSLYGQFITLSNYAEYSERSKSTLEDAVNVLADSASDTWDQLIRTMLDTQLSTYVSAASGGWFVGASGTATTASITTADTMQPLTLRKIARNFVANKVRNIRDGQAYVGVFSPYQTYDLFSDTTVLGMAAVSAYGNQPDRVFNYERGKLWGIRILESQNCLTASVTSSVTAYTGYVIGEDAWSSVALEGSPIEILVKTSGGTYDPFSNISTVAYKMWAGVAWLGSDGPRAYRVTTAVSA